MTFENYKTIFYKINVNSNKKNIAAFDMDYTIIKPKSNRIFPKDENDWKFLFGEITISKLREINKNYQIVIFTNQKGISKGRTTIEQISKKIYDIEKSLDINLDVVISSKSDYYRKPLTGMWRFYKKTRTNTVSKKKSFYVGDAAGRIYKNNSFKGKVKKDHSNDDRFFAYNIGLKFYTPEEFFGVIDEPHHIEESSLEHSKNKIINIDTSKNLVLFVGAPASGKTKLYKEKFNDYEHINMDTLKNKERCLKLTEYAMKYGKNIVVDNTNPDYSTRKKYLDLGKKYNYNSYIVNFKSNRFINNYYNRYRVQKSKGKRKLIPDVVYNVYYKKYEEPTIDEAKILNYSNYNFDEKYKF